MNQPPIEWPPLRELVHWRQYAPLQKWAIALLGVQMLAVVVAIAMARFEIESIVFTIPVLAVAGFAFAIVTWPLRSWRVLVLGLSAPLAAAGIAATIATFKLGSNQSRLPVLALLVVYALTALPLASDVLRMLIEWSSTRRTFPTQVRLPKQFSIKSLLLLMTALAVCLMLMRWLIVVVGGREFPWFAGFAVLNVALCGVLMYRFAAQYYRQS